MRGTLIGVPRVRYRAKIPAPAGQCGAGQRKYRYRVTEATSSACRVPPIFIGHLCQPRSSHPWILERLRIHSSDPSPFFPSLFSGGHHPMCIHPSPLSLWIIGESTAPCVVLISTFRPRYLFFRKTNVETNDQRPMRPMIRPTTNPPTHTPRRRNRN